MDLFEAVAARYSYRGAFTDEPVSRETLQKIVEAGLKAPSGKNEQTTSFVIADDLEILKAIGEMHTMWAMQQAKAFIACVIDREPDPIYAGHAFQVEDCSAAVQNILLAVTALGLGSVWVDGWLRVEGRAEKIGELLGIPSGKVVRVILPVGVPAKQGRRPEKLPFAKRAWFNRYGG
ncbi:MAG: nitroreductase family protein [Planctomycetota bacterium]|jgi:nitroreductase